MRVGFGFDSHPLREGRKLVLGGCEIPYPKGLFGHSDGDCLIHALVDAILGALNKNDIGSLFPDTDPRYEGVTSLYFLEEVREILARERFKIVNIDAVVISEAVMISFYQERMKNKIGEVLQISPGIISIKGKRGEGFAQDSIFSYVVVLLEKLCSP